MERLALCASVASKHRERLVGRHPKHNAQNPLRLLDDDPTPERLAQLRDFVFKLFKPRELGHVPQSLSESGLLGRACKRHPRPGKILLVQVDALTSSQCLYETLDLFLTREAAEAELREILQDEPDWKDLLRIVPIELDGRNVSVN